MKRNHSEEFHRPDGTTVICATDAQGNRLPTRYVRPDGTEAKAAPPKKEPRRIEPKRTGQPAKAESAPKLGDRVESALQSVGITKERWGAFKSAMGLPATCNCDARKQYLNKLGDELGEVARNAVAAIVGG